MLLLSVAAASADTAFQKQNNDMTSATQKSNRLMRLSEKEAYKFMRNTCFRAHFGQTSGKILSVFRYDGHTSKMHFD